MELIIYDLHNWANNALLKGNEEWQQIYGVLCDNEDSLFEQKLLAAVYK